MVAPVIMAFGTPEQQKRFLPGIASGEVWWSQGYSEPGSGSDLASLKTKRRAAAATSTSSTARRPGPRSASTATGSSAWCARSSEGKPQTGISFLLIDMKSPGITVRPIITMDGEHEVNEVLFDNVEVPADNLIGEENKGWTYAKHLLAHERTNIADVNRAKRELERLKRIAKAEGVYDDGRFRDQIALLEVDVVALEMMVLRVLSAEKSGKQRARRRRPAEDPRQRDPAALHRADDARRRPVQRVPLRSARRWRPAGRATTSGGAFVAPLASTYFNMRKTTIYGGINEVQRNIVAQTVLAGADHGLRFHRRPGKLRDTVRRWVERGYDFERRRAHRQGRRLLARGLAARSPTSASPACRFRKTQGGIGLGPVEAMVVMEELGRGLVLEPYAAVALVATSVLRRGHEAARGAVAAAHRRRQGDRRARPRRSAQSRYRLDARRDDRARQRPGLAAERRQERRCRPATRPTRSSSGARQRRSRRRGRHRACSSSIARRSRASRCAAIRRRTARARAELVLTEAAGHELVAPGAAFAGARARGRHRHRRALRRGGRRDGQAGRDHGRVHEHAQAVRRADRHLPGAAPPHRRRQDAARAGALDELLRDAQARRAEPARGAARWRRPRCSSASRCASSASSASSCTAASASPTNTSRSHYFKRLTVIEMTFGDTLHQLGEVSRAHADTAGVFA